MPAQQHAVAQSPQRPPQHTPAAAVAFPSPSASQKHQEDFFSPRGASAAGGDGDDSASGSDTDEELDPRYNDTQCFYCDDGRAPRPARAPAIAPPAVAWLSRNSAAAPRRLNVALPLHPPCCRGDGLLLCDGVCRRAFHFACLGYTVEAYEALCGTKAAWYCPECEARAGRLDDKSRPTCESQSSFPVKAGWVAL